jgi:hypothetical protein
MIGGPVQCSSYFVVGSGQFMQGEMRLRQWFGRETEVKRELARCRSRWQNDIKMDVKEISCADVHVHSLAHDRGQWKGCCEYGDEYFTSAKTWNCFLLA